MAGRSRSSPGPRLSLEEDLLLTLHIYLVDGRVEWRLQRVNRPDRVRTHGIWQWQRTGFVTLDERPRNDRQLLSVALRTILARLGEREDLSGAGE